MKKYLSILFLIAFIVPSVAFASWWNPISWFNNWNFFHKTEVKIDQEVIIPIPNTNTSEPEKNTAKDVEKNNQSVKVNPPKKSANVPVETKQTQQPINIQVQQPVVNTENQSEIDALKDSIKKLENKVQTLEGENNDVQEYIDNNIKLKPEVSLNKTVMNNDGSDQVKIQIKTINSDGKIVPNKEIEIITYTSDNENNKKVEKINTDENGNATYYTPTTTAYNKCGVYMTITIKIDGEFIFGQSIGIKNTQPVPANTGGGACA
jgi:hypothetical protein